MTPLVRDRDVQSVLAATGDPAQSIATLTWVLVAGAAVIFVLVLALAAWAAFAPPRARRWLVGERPVVAGGIVFPIATLSALLVYDLVILDHSVGGTDEAWARAAERAPPLEIDVEGIQWWWRVRYRDDPAPGASGAAPGFETANEIRIPAGRAVDLYLSSADVIHSFWVPSLAGKLDMIPGRTNRLRLLAQSPGVYRGQCAEYCGGAHAWMAFFVVALAPEEFEAWRTTQASAGSEPDDEQARRGREVFLREGCFVCHTVRGTPARGTVGPDLTHVGGRLSIAAGRLPNNVGAVAAWIASSRHLKPENHMPSYSKLAGPDLHALAAYLDGLK